MNSGGETLTSPATWRHSNAIVQWGSAGFRRPYVESAREDMMQVWVLGLLALAFSTGTSLAQDAAAGTQVFKRLCSPCHDVGPDAKVKLGPPLNGIDGRKAGTSEGYNYSQANKSSGITWDEESFSKYIRAPMQVMPGTKMAFAGIKNDKDVGDVWAYLKQLGPDGQKK
jgi:cytochrome c